ncbi:MAG: peptide chain release factor N(5)-glutamine methyltransferase [Alphaproteobacteria bacterium]
MNRAELIDEAARRLASRSGTPRLDARILWAHARGTDGAGDDESAGRFARLIARRLAGEPVSRILGRREFWSLDFALTPDVLDPRPDSETVVEAALTHLGSRDREAAVLDLGTGSGCLLLAVLSELPHAWGVGVDKSVGACRVARENALRLGLGARTHFVAGDWGTALGARFDAVLCNPPYIAERDIAALAPEVARHDPRAALAGGEDGLGGYRAVLADAARLLAPGGFVVLELGQGQGQAVRALAGAGGLRTLASHADLSGIERCVVLQTKHGVGC